MLRGPCIFVLLYSCLVKLCQAIWHQFVIGPGPCLGLSHGARVLQALDLHCRHQIGQVPCIADLPRNRPCQCGYGQSSSLAPRPKPQFRNALSAPLLLRPAQVSCMQQECHTGCIPASLKQFCNPSSIPTCGNLETLYRAWDSGQTYFKKMSVEDWEEWKEHWENQDLAPLTSVESTTPPAAARSARCAPPRPRP